MCKLVRVDGKHKRDTYYYDQVNKPISQPDFFKADYHAMRLKLKNIEWKETLKGKSAESYEEFTKIVLTTSMEGNVPNAFNIVKSTIQSNLSIANLSIADTQFWNQF